MFDWLNPHRMYTDGTYTKDLTPIADVQNDVAEEEPEA